MNGLAVFRPRAPAAESTPGTLGRGKAPFLAAAPHRKKNTQACWNHLPSRRQHAPKKRKEKILLDSPLPGRPLHILSTELLKQPEAANGRAEAGLLE